MAGLGFLETPVTSSRLVDLGVSIGGACVLAWTTAPVSIP
jgi:hypothetical protein